jgi:endonuclease/exonuclease/phosphatase family metal-dependent hydrolase
MNILRAMTVMTACSVSTFAMAADSVVASIDSLQDDEPMASLDSYAPLELVSANAWGLPDLIAPHRAERMRKLAAWVDTLDVDVVGLQEMWTGAVPLTPLRLTRAEHSWDDGLALHSRHHVENVDGRAYHDARGWDALKHKGVMRAELVRDAGPSVWLYITHLQAGHGKANAAVRELQVEELLAFVAEQDAPSILLGDFNADAQDAEDQPLLDRLAAAGLIDVASALERPEGTYPGDGRRYDRIFLAAGGGWDLVPEHVEVVRYDDDPATPAPAFFSDHQPLRATIRVVKAHRSSL